MRQRQREGGGEVGEGGEGGNLRRVGCTGRRAKMMPVQKNGAVSARGVAITSCALVASMTRFLMSWTELMDVSEALEKMMVPYSDMIVPSWNCRTVAVRVDGSEGKNRENWNGYGGSVEVGQEGEEFSGGGKGGRRAKARGGGLSPMGSRPNSIWLHKMRFGEKKTKSTNFWPTTLFASLMLIGSI